MFGRQIHIRPELFHLAQLFELVAARRRRPQRLLDSISRPSLLCRWTGFRGVQVESALLREIRHTYQSTFWVAAMGSQETLQVPFHIG